MIVLLVSFYRQPQTRECSANVSSLISALHCPNTTSRDQEAGFSMLRIMVRYNSLVTRSSNRSADRLPEITMQTVRLYSRGKPNRLPRWTQRMLAYR